jgi:hypothetical protein
MLRISCFVQLYNINGKELGEAYFDDDPAHLSDEYDMQEQYWIPKFISVGDGPDETTIYIPETKIKWDWDEVDKLLVNEHKREMEELDLAEEEYIKRYEKEFDVDLTVLFSSVKNGGNRV